MERQVWTLLVLVASISCCKRKSDINFVNTVHYELMDFMHNF